MGDGDDVRFSRHALERLRQRGISRVDVVTCLRRPIGGPSPGEPGTIWVRGHAESGRILKVCVPLDDRRFVITPSGPTREASEMVRLEYDPEADEMYLGLLDASVTQSVQIDEGTLVDLDDEGSVVGIEIVHPDRQWPLATILERFTLGRPDADTLRAFRSRTIA
jgi:uncharacterized protein YuzE